MHTKPRILMTEDDELQKELMGILLDAGHYAFDAVNNGREAISAIENAPFDLIILDLLMPEMGGIEFLHWLRDEYKSEIPVLVLTSLSSYKVRQEALDAGANVVLGKPFSVNTFVDEVETLLKKCR